ncbi:MAG TPA: DUF4097 family beta strand repeat-containing protein [Bacteroidales bacterium]|jgi:predicted membrane protein|nr:DUF4097 family beta strand repeat-containing protein [Bacteroidales bacterium]
MKKVLYILILSLFSASLNAQMKVDKNFGFTGKNKIMLDVQISDSIRVMTWDKNEVRVTASININENKDNEAYFTNFRDDGSIIAVKAGFKEDYFKGRKDHNVESEINWVVYMPERADLSIETINADITITGKTGPLNIKSISGFIDVTVPENRQASLDFSTISGTVYTNHLLTSLNSRSGIPSRIKNNLNNGGETIKLETISGDIFFRK